MGNFICWKKKGGYISLLFIFITTPIGQICYTSKDFGDEIPPEYVCRRSEISQNKRLLGCVILTVDYYDFRVISLIGFC